MKVLMIINMPGQTRLNDKTIFGGTERFAQLMYQNIPDVIPVELTSETRRSRQVDKIIYRSIMEHNPDVIVTNNDSKLYTIDLLKYDIPHVWFFHTPCIRTVWQVNTMKIFDEYVKNGGNLYFMSEYQKMFFNEMFQRVVGETLRGVAGFINPAFALDEWKGDDTNETSYDVVTIGRNAAEKNPFLLHKKTSKTSMKSLVITNSASHLRIQKYSQRNTHWRYPQETMYDLSHDDVIENLRMGDVFVSTMPEESWGITALEALCNGLPCIFFTGKKSCHASQMIADTTDDYRLLPKSCSVADFECAVRELQEYASNNKIAISTRHKEKHSKSKWKSDISKVLEKAVKDHNTKRRLNIDDFFI